MFAALCRPDDDDEIVEVFFVEHETKTKEHFEYEWLVAKDKVLYNNPEYNVAEIIVAMKRKGWNIIHTSPAKVTY